MEESAPASIAIEILRVRDLARIAQDLEGHRSRYLRFGEQTLLEPLTRVRWTSSSAYLIRLPPPEVMWAPDHYMLWLDGQVFEVSTEAFGNRLVFEDCPTKDASTRARVMAMFVEGLKVYGRFGRGQDGKFNSTDQQDAADWMDPYFAEDGATPT